MVLEIFKKKMTTATPHTPETFQYIGDARGNFGQYKSDNYVLCHLCDDNSKIERNGYKEYERNALCLSPCVVVCFDCHTACTLSSPLWNKTSGE